MNEIICGDCLKVLPTLPRAKMIFADPPDNIGVEYDDYNDHEDLYDYLDWLLKVIKAAVTNSEIFWLSYNYIWDLELKGGIFSLIREKELPDYCSDAKTFIWRYTFGQHRKTDCGNGYRPILRLMRPGARIYPMAICTASARQTKYNDKRANLKGRIPDDVWEFPRVCGTFIERRKWFPNQHPEALIERMVKLSCNPRSSDLVIDMFAGSGTVNRVCKRLGINCIGIEISENYCKNIAKETKAKLRIYENKT